MENGTEKLISDLQKEIQILKSARQSAEEKITLAKEKINLVEEHNKHLDDHNKHLDEQKKHLVYISFHADPPIHASWFFVTFGEYYVRKLLA